MLVSVYVGYNTRDVYFYETLAVHEKYKMWPMVLLTPERE